MNDLYRAAVDKTIITNVTSFCGQSANQRSRKYDGQMRILNDWPLSNESRDYLMKFMIMKYENHIYCNLKGFGIE